MLSRMRCFSAEDGRRRLRVHDLGVADMTEDHPTVSHVLLRTGPRERATLPWSAVRDVDWRRGRLRVADLADARPRDAARAPDIWLVRDVLDAMVLNLQERRATRANDLWLREENGALRLEAADTGALAVWRRVTGGRFGHRAPRTLYDWKYVEFLRGLPRARHHSASGLRLSRLPAGDLASLSDALPYLHAAELLTVIPPALAADTLELLAPERQLQVFEELDDKLAPQLLQQMSPDVAADLLGTLSPDEARRQLERLPGWRRERILALLRYPTDTVGGIMTNDIVTLPATLTAREAREAIREQLTHPDFVYLVYVVESADSPRLAGVITLRELMLAEDGARIADAMNPYVSVLHPLEGANGAAYRLLESHLAAMPVVGAGGEIVGVVTIDAALARAGSTWSTRAPRVFS